MNPSMHLSLVKHFILQSNCESTNVYSIMSLNTTIVAGDFPHRKLASDDNSESIYHTQCNLPIS